MSKTDIVVLESSDRPRLGVRGVELDRWLDAHSYSAGDECNVAYAQTDGSLIGRLSASELLWLGEAGKLTGEKTLGIEQDFRCYTVSRRDSHAWFELRGTQAPQLLAKLCGVDMRPEYFDENSIAQTSVAKISTIVIRPNEAGVPVYHLLVDSSFARYFYKALLDAKLEFEKPQGKPHQPAN